VKHYLNQWKNFGRIKGRATRQEFWMFYLISTIVLFVLMLIGINALDSASYGYVYPTLSDFYPMIFFFIFALVTLIQTYVVGIRRFHDTGRSGAYILIGFIPIVGGILQLIWLCEPSQEGDNRYGPDPHATKAVPLKETINQ
jgi:uncharacterized membrane protein YhaH (DUF805 family)